MSKLYRILLYVIITFWAIPAFSQSAAVCCYTPLDIGVRGVLGTVNGGTGVTTGIAPSTAALKSATTVVDVSASAAPTPGQLLTAVDTTHATWQTVSGTGSVTSVVINGTANQITATGTCSITAAGTCTLSIPSTLQLPGTVNNVTITQPASTAVFTLASAKTFTVNNSITLAGTDGVTLTAPSTNAVLARTDAAQTFTGTQTYLRTIINHVSTVSFSATPAFDLSQGDQVITLTGNITSFTFTNLAAGEVFSMKFCQDGTGSRTISSPPASLHGFFTIGSTPSTCSVQEFESFDGTTVNAKNTGIINQ